MVSVESASATPLDSDYLRLLQEALERRATDLHVDPLIDSYQIRVRIDGVLEVLRPATRGEGERLINQFKAAAGIEPGTVFTPKGVRERFRVGSHEVDARITLVTCVSGPKLAVRLLDPRMVLHSVTELGLEETELEEVRSWLSELNGMFLVSGPTASGKTTTLYALLHELAEESRHIVTIEDPADYELDGINQIQVDPRHGVDFAEGVRTILRLDPDHAMIGELRDPASTQAAVAASIAGHVVLTSLHSRDTVSAVTVLRNFGVENHQIAPALGVVVNQRLIRTLCRHCRKQASISKRQGAWLESLELRTPQSVWQAVGCPECRELGYKGRTGLFELWKLRERDYELILAGADEQTLRGALRQRGHVDLWERALAKVERGESTLEEVQRVGMAMPWQ